MFHKVFYAAGPGDVVRAHECWRRGELSPDVTAITYSGQVNDFCRAIGATVYLVSNHEERRFVRDGAFLLENRPKPWPSARGLRYHLSQIGYGLGLWVTAVRFGADVALIASGTTHCFVLGLFRLAGIRVVPLLHNTLWPAGFPPTKASHRFLLWLDNHLFWRWVPEATLGVSRECLRQVEELTGGRQHGGLHVFKAQYSPEFARSIPPPPPHGARPFRIVFFGRVVREKGVFDILEIARRIEARMPGEVRWEICGEGTDLAALIDQNREMGLASIVTIHGWTDPEKHPEIYRRCHAAIVPTRGGTLGDGFSEGMAKSAVEAILAGRPLITNSVVPALEALRDASMECRVNDVDCYVRAVERLVRNPDLYARLRDACQDLSGPFLDGKASLTSVLREALCHSPPSRERAVETTV